MAGRNAAAISNTLRERFRPGPAARVAMRRAMAADKRRRRAAHGINHRYQAKGIRKLRVARNIVLWDDCLSNVRCHKITKDVERGRRKFISPWGNYE